MVAMAAAERDRFITDAASAHPPIAPVLRPRGETNAGIKPFL